MSLEYLSEQALIDLSRAQRETELRLFPAYLRDLPDEAVQRFQDHCLIAGALDVAAECSERLTHQEQAA